MSLRARRPRLVLVTDPRYTIDHVVAVTRAAGRAVGPGRLLVQLRDKVNAPDHVVAVARALREATHAVEALFLVNGSVEIAKAVGADGVHVPSGGSVAGARHELGASAFVSAPAHDDQDVGRAIEEGASAVLVSPIFATPGKGAPRGASALTAARALADRASSATAASGDGLLVYALGGVEVERAASCAEAGADGVAVIRALLDLSGDGRISAAARVMTAPF
ncbi:Thiamin-phosphate pyrophosphorylase [Labilithrix luteola]|uniref:Thiamin-phosphate pyrophosphorylase n=1 Tax=Labilithrix luteola TaxID=1391654 RepID=A0A0K1QA06_9BACT|nr:thiamine phosphate synthase [Labilithrix luteola]AKV02225.1 Thiamin-phosphate pyrophosphorylase [Labilithrix luteola]